MMTSTTAAALIERTGYTLDRLIGLTKGSDTGVAFIAETAIRQLTAIGYGEITARECLDAVAKKAADATTSLDFARNDDGRWVTHHAANAAEAMAKIQEAASQFVTYTAVLDKALAGN